MIIGIVGYALLILEGVGFGLLIGPSWPDGISLMLVWYGLYYGVLGRDLAEVAGDRMVSNVLILLATALMASNSKHARCSLQHFVKLGSV